MYNPSPFAQEDSAALFALMDASRLVTLVTAEAGVPSVSHVPVLVDKDRGSHGTVRCHIARANPQWRSIDPQSKALAVFVGPDAYISPAWYDSGEHHGMVVPTWNYLAVHAYGTIRAFHDHDRLLALVDGLTRKHEAGFPHPWNVSDAPPDFIAAQLRGIVGLEIEIERLEGKWKLGQNRSAADVAGAAAALESSDNQSDRAIAEAMRAARALLP